MNKAIDNITSFIVMDVLERAKAMQAQGIDVIHLEVGEPDFDVPSCVAESAKSAIEQGVTHYSHSLGDADLRQAIAIFYHQEYGVTVNPDCIVVTSGSSPAILLAIMVLCEAGGEVILSNPGYACYSNFVRACNGVPVEVDLTAESGFQFNVEKVKQAITSRTRAIFINSPMNPTGTLLSGSVMQQLSELNIPILSDEIYHGLVYKGKVHSILEYTQNAFVLNGFSKRFAMTGLRLGYLIAPPEYMRNLQVLQQNLFICAPSIAQRAGIAALTQASADVDRMRDIYNERRIYMINRLRQMGFTIHTEPQGAFYIFADASRFTTDSYRFAFDMLEKAHVGVTPGIDFGSRGEGYIRFSYANSLDNIKKALDRVEQYLKTLI